MANKGKGLMSEEAWKEMHAEPIYGEYGSTKGTALAKRNVTSTVLLIQMGVAQYRNVATTSST